MEEIEYQRMFEAEERSWWFRARRRILEKVLSRLDLPESARIADLGCGTGGNLEMLAKFGDVTGVEPSHTAAQFARRRTGATVVEGDAVATTLPDHAFDLVTMLDVLEHLEDDRAGLAEVKRILKPGGTYLITVPAFMFLWSSHDEALHHYRRYRRPQLKRLLAEAGLEVSWMTYFNAALFPPVAAVRVGRKLLRRDGGQADGVEVLPQPFNSVFEAIFASERWWVGRIPAPFGVSLVGIARA